MTIRRGYVDVPDGQIHTRMTGSGAATPLLCLHRTAASGVMWEGVMQAIGRDRPVYAIDTPGFGGSFDPAGMPSMKEYVRWASQAADALGLQRFHIVGHHTGACIATELAATQPERVASLSLIGIAYLNDAEKTEFKKIFSSPFSPNANGDYLKTTWEYVAALGANRSLPLQHQEFLDTARAYLGRYQAFSAVWDQDFAELFAQVKCPILAMCADDDVLWPFFQRAVDARPDAKSRVLKGATFSPELDTENTVAALREFLA
jgi:pimeloyl-ACP methyl ester carboxylesterase